jgi:ABC-type Fe3+/spermidine/putrescine transport system ATPase subunit
VKLAIRPEDIRIGTADGSNTMTGRLDDREFRGSHYRLRVTLAAENAEAEPPVLNIDVPSHELDGLPMENGGALAIQLPAACLLAFPETGD